MLNVTQVELWVIPAGKVCINVYSGKVAQNVCRRALMHSTRLTGESISKPRSGDIGMVKEEE